MWCACVQSKPACGKQTPPGELAAGAAGWVTAAACLCMLGQLLCARAADDVAGGAAGGTTGEAAASTHTRRATGHTQHTPWWHTPAASGLSQGWHQVGTQEFTGPCGVHAQPARSWVVQCMTMWVRCRTNCCCMQEQGCPSACLVIKPVSYQPHLEPLTACCARSCQGSDCNCPCKGCTHASADGRELISPSNAGGHQHHATPATAPPPLEDGSS